MKTGRNKPCPCGSGKKYKDCHGRTKPSKFPVKVLVVKEPDGLKVYDASSELRCRAAALAIYRRRMSSNVWSYDDVSMPGAIGEEMKEQQEGVAQENRIRRKIREAVSTGNGELAWWLMDQRKGHDNEQWEIVDVQEVEEVSPSAFVGPREEAGKPTGTDGESKESGGQVVSKF